ncbi:MAG: hypothetical protein ACLRWQ_19485 [Flavonifractor plautii]
MECCSSASPWALRISPSLYPGGSGWPGGGRSCSSRRRLCSVTLYFLLENIAGPDLRWPPMCGVLVSVGQVLTALLSHFLLRRERLRPLFFAGLAVALAGWRWCRITAPPCWS